MMTMKKKKTDKGKIYFKQIWRYSGISLKRTPSVRTNLSAL